MRFGARQRELATTFRPVTVPGIAVLALSCLSAVVEPAFGAWQTFSTRDGLPANEVNSILEDDAGNLWFATGGAGINGGIARYDGLAWRTYTTADGLASNDVRSILQDRSGNWWFGTWGGGVSRYDGASWSTFTTADGLANNFVRPILEDRDGNLWFGTSAGVSRYDGSTWQTFRTVDGLGANNVSSIMQDRAGGYWFGTDGGASHFDGSNWRTFTTAEGLNNNRVYSIVEDRAGALWFGTGGGGVSRYDGSTWQLFTTANGLAYDSVRFILEDRAGNLWFGTSDPSFTFGNGVSRYDGSSWQTFTTADGLANNVVRFITQDRAGNLWFGTFGGGASRYDGSSWKNFTTADGLAGRTVMSIMEDRAKNLWFGTNGGGVSRYDGSSWTTVNLADGYTFSMLEDHSGNLWFATFGGVARYDGTTFRTFTTADGLASNTVSSILEDRAGNLWFGTFFGGVSRFDGTTWRTYRTEDGLGSNYVWQIVEDRAGAIWFATMGGGASRYDGSTWQTFTRREGLACDSLLSMFVDSVGDLWFGTGTRAGGGNGVSRYDAVGWQTFTTADGLAADDVKPILKDRSGILWFGTARGLSFYDGTTWRTYAGLPNNIVPAILEDHSGNLWFGTDGAGVSRYVPDRVPPWTVFLSVPLRVSSSRNPSAILGAFGEVEGIDFSYRVDGGAWSSWSAASNWIGADMADGTHVLEVRSRDFWLNTDSTAAVATFEIDATPPAPLIASPAFGQPVRGSAEIRGTAADARLKDYRVEARPAGAPSWDPGYATLLHQSTTQVSGGLLADWDTASLPDGLYDLRVAATDSLGLTGTTQVTVIVDNHAPFADETSPAKVTAASGGDVFTTNSEVHLYFPPHAFSTDAVVMMAPLDGAAVNDTLASGAVLVDPGYEFSWSGGALQKAARLEFSYAGVSAPPPGVLALYRSANGETWQRLGGTVDSDARKISLAITDAGRYALYADQGAPSGPRTVSGLAFTPRVFSPAGTFADPALGISFTLGRPGAVTIKVYSRSGRLIREVASGASLGAGANLIRWDGRDREGSVVTDGLYLVTVEAFGETEKKALAVVK